VAGNNLRLHLRPQVPVVIYIRGVEERVEAQAQAVNAPNDYGANPPLPAKAVLEAGTVPPPVPNSLGQQPGPDEMNNNNAADANGNGNATLMDILRCMAPDLTPAVHKHLSFLPLLIIGRMIGSALHRWALKDSLLGSAVLKQLLGLDPGGHLDPVWCAYVIPQTSEYGVCR
jgi:hypothetical protein